MRKIEIPNNAKDLVMWLWVDGLGFEWLDHAIFTKNGKLDRQNFSYNSEVGRANIVKVVNKLGRDSDRLLYKYNKILEIDDGTLDDDMCKLCRSIISNLENTINLIGTFVIKYYQKDGNLVDTDSLATDMSLLKILNMKLEFKKLLKIYEISYAEEIKHAFELSNQKYL